MYCKPDPTDAIAVPLEAGDCTMYDGFTLHCSHGNKTGSQRRALILNFRPQKMIDYERERGVDHTGERNVRNAPVKKS